MKYGKVDPVRGKKKWIAGANLKEGAFTKKAEAKGEGVQEYAAEVKAKKKAGKKVDITTLRQALLAQTFKKMAARR